MTEAIARLNELVRLAEAGEDVILMRQGRPAVRLDPVRRKLRGAEFRAAIEAIQASARSKATPGPDAARSQDYLYDEDGLPA